MEEVKRKEQELPPKNEERKKEKGKEDILQYRSPKEGFFFFFSSMVRVFPGQGGHSPPRGVANSTSPHPMAVKATSTHTHTKKEKVDWGSLQTPTLPFFVCVGGDGCDPPCCFEEHLLP